MDVITCENLTKRFGPAIAVNGLDLAVSPGQVYGFLGFLEITGKGNARAVAAGS